MSHTPGGSRVEWQEAEDIEYNLQKAIDDYENQFKLGPRLTNPSCDPYSVVRGHENLSISIEKIAKIMDYGKLDPSLLRIWMRKVASQPFDYSVSMKWTASPINHQLSLSEVSIRLVEHIILHNCVAPIEGYLDYGKYFQHAIRKLLPALGRLLTLQPIPQEGSEARVQNLQDIFQKHTSSQFSTYLF